MLRDLLLTLYDLDVGIAGGGPCPDAVKIRGALQHSPNYQKAQNGIGSRNGGVIYC